MMTISNKNESISEKDRKMKKCGSRKEILNENERSQQ
jgi:hypothetical protein